MVTTPNFTPRFTFDHSSTAAGGAEIVKYDAATQRIFVVGPNGVDILNAVDGTLVTGIDLTSVGGPNSLDVSNGVLAVAVAAQTNTDNGTVRFYDTDGNFTDAVTVGANPDMVTFTPDGTKVLVANEGEPNDAYTVDPVGSVSIITVADKSVQTATFDAFNSQEATLEANNDIRFFGPNATVAQDAEPEFIALNGDASKAWVTMQENNAIAIVDIATATVERIITAGVTNYNTTKFDPSNEDGGFNQVNANVLSFNQPDAITSFVIDGATYFVTANEGDARDYDGFSEEVRVDDLTLDPTVYPDAATLQLDANLGRLKTTTANGDTDGDGDTDQIYGYGGRSFTIFDSTGNIVFESGDRIETLIGEQFPSRFVDSRSDDKGPEPEAVTVGTIGDKTYLFVGNERTSEVMLFDVSTPTAPEFAGFVARTGDVSPEGLDFVASGESASGKNELIVANEVSNTTTVHQQQDTFTLQILHASDLEGGVDAIQLAPNFAAIEDYLDDQISASITLSAGDNYLPGPFFNASSDRSIRTDLQTANTQIFSSSLGEGETLSNFREGGGRIDISIMNAIGFDASAVGNHEFDLGTDTFEGLIEPDIRGATVGDVRYLGAQFPYLSANLDFSSNGDLSNLYTSSIISNESFRSLPNDLSNASTPQIAPATVIEEDGQRIGVVGATTQVIESISSTGNVVSTAGTTNDMTALAAVLQPIVDQMVADGINKIVLVSHLQQFALEQELATLLDGVDVIVAGGSDTRLLDSEDVARGSVQPGDTSQGDYPFLTTDKSGNPVAVVSTDGEYSYVGRLVVDFNADGILQTSSIDPNVSGAYATTTAQVEALWGSTEAAFASGTAGNTVQTLVNSVTGVVTAQDGNTFGSTSVYIDGERSQVRTEETNLGNLTADANLFVAQQHDSTVTVSIKNGGGIRSVIGETSNEGATTQLLPPQANALAGKEEGQVSQLDISNSLRFNNSLTLLTLTADQLLATVEHAVSATADGATPGQFGQFGGIQFAFDDDLPAGDRVTSLTIVDQNNNNQIVDVIARDGEVIGDGSREIRVVTLNFLVDGGDNYPFEGFITENAARANRVELTDVLTDTGSATFANPGTEQDALAEYLAANFSSTPFAEAEVDPGRDSRIQNLDKRADDVLGNKYEGQFVESFYLAANPDLAAAGLTGDALVAHFQGGGFYEGRLVEFNAAEYLQANPDVAAAGFTTSTAITHYLAHGESEDRLVQFSGAQYLAANPDLAAQGVTEATALDHFLTTGRDQGRIDSFDARGYLLANPDVAAAGFTTDTAITHYSTFGKNEGRGFFDGAGYAFANADVAASATPGASHFDLFGQTEGRSPAIKGSQADDTIFAGAGDDIIRGLGGDDTLEGGAGSDIHIGGAGADLFKLVTGESGADVIGDFNFAEGDRLLIENRTGAALDRDAIIAGASDNAAGNAVFTLSSDQTLELIGVSTSDLSAEALFLTGF